MRENRWQSSRPIPFGIRFYIAIWIDVFKFQNLVKFNLLNWDRLAGLLISHFQNFQPTFSILYLSCCWEKLGFITEFRGRMATISVSRMKFHSPISGLGNLRTNQPLRQNERSETHSVNPSFYVFDWKFEILNPYNRPSSSGYFLVHIHWYFFRIWSEPAAKPWFLRSCLAEGIFGLCRYFYLVFFRSFILKLSPEF